MLATAEDLLGLPPMAITDARANRMWPSFSRRRPNMRTYVAITPTAVPFGDPAAPVKLPNAPMVRQSTSWDFSKGDDQPEVALNRAIWKSIKGPTPRCRVRAMS